MDKAQPQQKDLKSSPAAHRVGEASSLQAVAPDMAMTMQHAFLEGVHRSPVLAAQRKFVSGIDGSPHVVAQHLQLKRLQMKPGITINDHTGVLQRESAGQGQPEAHRPLLDALEDIRGGKPKVTGVSDGEWQEAIAEIDQVVRSGDKPAIAQMLNSLQAQAPSLAGPSTSLAEGDQDAVQFSGWRFAGAIVGGILGTLLCPFIGTYLVARKGWELGKNWDDINLLYAAGATVAEVNAMMLVEPDPVTLLTQIQAETAQNATRVSQLYAAGATSAQVTVLLAREPNGATLLAQIQAEAAHSVTLVEQLHVVDGATSAQVTALLAREPNGATLHAQVQAEATHSVALVRQLYVVDGASSAQLTALLAREPDAATLHAQVQAEAAHSVALVRQLYVVDGATSAQLTALLAREPDAATLHAQVQAEAAHSVALVRQLYVVDGATSAQLTALLAREPDAATLHAQVQAEAAHSAALVHQLYTVDAATSAQVTALLAREPDAATLHAQVQAEATHSAALVHQLYTVDTTTSAQVTALLAREPDAATLHAQVQAEAAHSATLVHQLHVTDAATSPQVTALLAIEPDGATLHTQIQAEAAHSATLVHQLYVTDAATSAQVTAMLAAQNDGVTLHRYAALILRQNLDGQAIDAAMMTRIGRQLGTTAALAGVQSGNLGENLVWSQQNPDLDGSDFGNWLLNGGVQPNVNDGNMNCWEVVLFGTFTAGYVNFAWLQHFYQAMQISLQTTPAASLMNNQFYENRLRVGAQRIYDPLLPLSPRPLEGDIVVFDRAVSHTALALGNPLGSPQVYSLWDEPNADDFLQLTDVAALLAHANGPVRFFSPSWM
ncbi:hypothetical protein [Rhizobacter sp. P5_C2]